MSFLVGTQVAGYWKVVGMSEESNAQSTEKEESQRESPSSANKGWADVAIHFINVLYDLTQSGNIIGLIVFAFFAWVFLVTTKIPSEDISGVLYGIGGFIGSEKFYLFPLSIALLFCLITNRVQAKTYKSHIQELTEHRKTLVHGLDDGGLKKLDRHHSSEFDIESNSIKDRKGEE